MDNDIKMLQTLHNIETKDKPKFKTVKVKNVFNTNSSNATNKKNGEKVIAKIKVSDADTTATKY
jgi:hypothetical protein|tara:strand:- start:479 stop:670 length:192 start_codon:yes stop_codon:yes gene_type:complete